jgi:hypothetical protein
MLCPHIVQSAFAPAFFMAPSTAKFKWGIPVNIPMPPSGDGELPPWTDLKFNPLGIYNLRRRIGALAGEPGVFTRYQHRFEAADLAWFAAGASEDDDHHIPADSFHQAFDILRTNLPSGEEGGKWRKQLRSRLGRIIFDLVRCVLISFKTSSVDAHAGYSVGSRLW